MARSGKRGEGGRGSTPMGVGRPGFELARQRDARSCGRPDTTSAHRDAAVKMNGVPVLSCTERPPFGHGIALMTWEDTRKYRYRQKVY